MNITYQGGNGKRHESNLPKVMLDKIDAKIHQMEVQHASPSRIEVSNMLHEAKSVLQEYCKGAAISLQFLLVIKRFSYEVQHPSETQVSLFCKVHNIMLCKESQINDNKQMASFAAKIRAWFRLIFTERISRQFRDRSILNDYEVVVNLDSDVLLAKSGTNK